MRTKQTSRPAPSAANSKKGRVPRKKKSSDAKPVEKRSPTTNNSPDPDKILAWLNRSMETPWSVSTTAQSNKRKRDAPKMEVEDRLFEDRLTVQYEVKPRDKWESLRSFKKFTGRWSVKKCVDSSALTDNSSCI